MKNGSVGQVIAEHSTEVIGQEPSPLSQCDVAGASADGNCVERKKRLSVENVNLTKRREIVSRAYDVDLVSVRGHPLWIRSHVDGPDRYQRSKLEDAHRSWIISIIGKTESGVGDEEARANDEHA